MEDVSLKFDLDEENTIIANLMHNGKYLEVVNLIDSILKSKSLKLKDILELKLKRARALYLLKPSEGSVIDLIENLILESRQEEFPLLEAESLIVLSSILNVNGQPEEAKKKLNHAADILEKLEEKDTDEFKKIKAFLLCIRGYNHLLFGEQDKSMDSLNESLALNKELGDKNEVARVYDTMSHVMYSLGKFDEVFKYQEKTYEISKELGNKRISCLCLMGMGNSLWQRGKLTEAYSYWKQCLDLALEINSQPRIAGAYNCMAIYYAETGKLDTALEYFQKSMKIYEEIMNWQRYTTILNNIGEIYWRKGDFDKAIETFNEVIAVSKEKNALFQMYVANRYYGFVYASLGELDKALSKFQEDLDFFKKMRFELYVESLHYLGLIYWQKGDEERSISLLNECIKLREENDTSLWTAFSLLELIKIYIEKNNDVQANLCFLKLTKINDLFDNKYLSLICRLAESMILLSTDSPRDKINAEYLLEQIVKEPIIFYSYTIDAILLLCEFYLLELKSSADNKFIKKLNNLELILSDISKKQHSFSLTIDILWLKSQLSLLNYDTKTALGLLVQAQQLAKEKGLNRHYQKFTKELDELNLSLSKWIKFKEEKTPVLELLQHIKIDKTLESIRIDTAFDAQSVNLYRNLHLKHTQ